MILHLIHDDKVLPRMISQFEEVCPGNNIYVCVIRACDNNNLKYLHDNPYVIKSDTKEIDNISWERIDKICIHYLSFSKIKYFWKLCYKYNLNSCKVIWFIWGGDVYDILERKGFNLYSRNNSYLTLRKPYRRSPCLIGSFIRVLSKKIRTVITDFVLSSFIDKRIDYIVCWDEEYDLFTRYLRFSRCKGLLRYSYYPLEDTLGPLIDNKINGNSIIIGNSASESNNHEYILKIVGDLDFCGNKIYIPLSYGDDIEYIHIIEEKYKKLANVAILKCFLPLEEYHNLLMSCSTFIYGNFRQEAWGNILIALYLGGKVYLSEKSILSKTLKKAGYKFFITEHIKETLNIQLTEEEKYNNRRIAMELCSREQNKRNIKYISNL